MNIIKRSGEVQEFKRTKIINAISKANTSVKNEDKLNWEQIDTISKEVEKYCQSFDRPATVEEVQDRVELQIMMTGKFNLAKNYITYRYLHTLARDQYKDLMDKVSEKLTARNVVNQNANVDEFSFGGRTGETASVITKEYALKYLMSEKARKAHEDNTIYTHDLDSYSVGMHNCLTVPVDYLLKHGFNTRQTDVRPAKSINTAFQLIAVLFQLQSLQQFGGVSAGHLDTTMVRYIRYSLFKHYVMNYIKKTDDFYKLDLINISSEDLDDWIDNHKEQYLKMFNLKFEDFTFANRNDIRFDTKIFKEAIFDTVIETKQAIEGLYHNLNTLQSRSGCQLPFTSINYGLDTTEEGRMCVRYLLETLISGIGKQHRTSVFPCGIFQVKNGVNRKPGDPNYDLFRLALKCTAKRLYPNYANCDWSVQVAAIESDRRVKADVLRSLSDEQLNKLVKFLTDHPDQLPLLGLKFEDGQIQIDFSVSPLEEMGTMGK